MARIEIAGVWCEHVQGCWTVGEQKRRIIKGRPSKETLHPQFSGGMIGALGLFMGRAERALERGQGTDDDRRLYDLLAKHWRQDR